MDYDFTRRDAVFTRKVFVLCLDRKKMTERIIIGEAAEAHSLLERKSGNVYFDETRPMGTLLFGFEADKDRTWNVNAMRLHESYGTLSQSKRWKLSEQANAFLREKYAAENPAAMFAAMRTWDEYLNCYNINHGRDIFLERTSRLYRPFYLYGDYRPWQEEAVESLSKAIHAGESQTELWYPVKKRPFECVVAHSSFQPLIFYYLHKIEEWGLHFQKCKICDGDFLAPSARYELCSEKCRKVQAVESKREFDERAKKSMIEQLDEAAYYYWYNHLRRLKRRKTADPERITAVESAMAEFRSESKRQKAEVKRGTIRQEDYTRWLAEQRDVVDRIMGIDG